MVLTRSGNGLRIESNEGRSLNVVKKRKYTRKTENQLQEGHGFNYHYSPLSASQIQLTYSGPQNLLSDVLKHHHNNVIQTYERKISMIPRRNTKNDKSYQQSEVKEDDNTESNLTYIQHVHQLSDGILPNPLLQADIQCSKDKIPTMDQEVNPHPILTTTDLATPHPIPTTADLATGGNYLSVSNFGSSFADVAAIGADVASNRNIQDDQYSPTLNNNSQPTQSLNVTEMVEQMNIDEEDEVDSLACDNSLISIRGYKIKPQYVELLTSIFSKYGDIGANCSNKPVPIRSFYMEYPCIVLEKLGQTEFVNITKNEIEDILDSLSHLEGENVNVGWLKNRVQEIYEANLSVSKLRSSNLRQSLVDKQSKIRKLEEELEFYSHDYEIKKSELAKLEEKICVTKKVLSEEIDEVKATKGMIADYKAKLKSVFELKSLAKNLI